MMVSRALGATLTLSGSASVEALQRALVNLAIATGRPAINPGNTTGDVNDATMIALGSAMGLLTEELPSEVYLALQAALIFGATNATAKKYVGQYAPQLTIAANTAAVKFKQNPTVPVPVPQLPPTTPSIFDQLFPTGWYKTPFGLLLIGVGLFVGYKFILAPKAKA